MDLRDLLSIEGADLDLGSICLMRHTGVHMGEYLRDPLVLSFYTSLQHRGRLDRHRYVIAFVVGERGKTVFRGMYQIHESSPLRQEHYLSLFLPPSVVSDLDAQCGGDELDFYRLTPCSSLSSYQGRLVIDWGRANIVWFQTFSLDKPKEVLEILPAGFFRAFDGYSSLSLTRFELEFLFENPGANPEWVGHLSRVAGIYLILDEGTGVQYIGSASGRRGVWGRWSDYFSDPSGGNVLLRDLLAGSPTAYRRFRYSLLEVMPGNTVATEVVAKETLYKKMLGTRAHGLNLN